MVATRKATRARGWAIAGLVVAASGCFFVPTLEGRPCEPDGGCLSHYMCSVDWKCVPDDGLAEQTAAQAAATAELSGASGRLTSATYSLDVTVGPARQGPGPTMTSSTYHLEVLFPVPR